MLKRPLKYERDTSEGKIHYFLRQFHLIFFLMTAGRITGELWWTNQEFYSVDIIPPWPSVLVISLTWAMIIGSLVAAVQRRSISPST
jgi:hypothetical protein